MKELERSLIYIAHIDFIDYMLNKELMTEEQHNDFYNLLSNKDTVRLAVNKLRGDYGEEMKKINLSFSYNGGGDSGDIEMEDESFREPFELTMDKLSDSIDYDWYNNDGGDGEAIFDLFNFTFSYDGVSYVRDSVEESGEFTFEEMFENID